MLSFFKEQVTYFLHYHPVKFPDHSVGAGHPTVREGCLPFFYDFFRIFLKPCNRNADGYIALLSFPETRLTPCIKIDENLSDT